MKEGDMRKKLQQLGIPPMGSKQLMEKRHTHWVNLWNANCDSDHPRTKQDLLNELNTWERTQLSNNTSTVMQKDFDGEKWSTRNNDQFKELIAQAKSRGQAKLKHTADKPTESSGQKDSAMIDVPESSGKNGPDAPAMEMFKAAMAPESSTDDDSLYRARTPPRLKKNSSSLSNPATQAGKKVPMFQVPAEPVTDVDMIAK
jgi:hypothetical protein